MAEQAKDEHRSDQTSIDGAAALEDAMERAIAACDGDLRATIRALLVSNSYLHEQVERMRALISPGFMRGRLSLLDLP